MRFITHNLTEIMGIEIFPILSLMIFVLFFAFVLLRVVRMTKAEVAELSDLPLNDATKLNDELNQ